MAESAWARRTLSGMGAPRTPLGLCEIARQAGSWRAVSIPAGGRRNCHLRCHKIRRRMVSGLYFGSDRPNEPRASRPLRVLVADDERDTVLTLMALLRTEGHEAKGFHGGRDALRAVEEFDPDVVILDIAMPDLNGWDVAREIRRQLPGSRPMLIAVSGEYTKSADKLLGRIAGFDYYLVKPCDPSLLMRLIARVTTS